MGHYACDMRPKWFEKEQETPQKPKPPQPKTRFRINPHAYAKLIDALFENPCTYAELAEITGLHNHTVRTYVKALHRLRPNHVVRIAEWHEDSAGRAQVPAFQISRSRDKPRPAQTPAQRAKKYRENRKLKQRQLAILGKGEYFRAKNGKWVFRPIETP